MICNAMADYADLLMEYIRQSDYEGYQKAFYEVYAERCRKISLKLQAQIGYDRDAAIERCRAKKKYYGQGNEDNNNDVGEEALVMAVRKSKAQAKAQEGEKGDKQDHG